MSEKTAIEWCHHTTNLALGCQKLSAGCKHCYAAELSRINPGVLGVWGPDGTRVLRPEAWRKDILSFARKARKAGERRRVFINSMSDLAEGVVVNGRESETEIRPDYLPLWDVVLSVAAEVADCLDLLTLTKRPRILAGVLEGRELPENLWIGASVEDQAAADARIPHLLRIPARVRFLSCEPLLGAVNLGFAAETWNGCPIDWVIVGGESGRNARPMHPDWARSLRDQCQNAGVPFFFKQNGEYIVEPSAVTEGDHIFPDGLHMARVGKVAAGRRLDGREWSGVPE